jgi:hypothetical protein
MHIINLKDNKAQLSQLVRRLVPFRPKMESRPGGQLRGRIRIAANFHDFGPELGHMYYGDEPPRGLKE